MSIEKGYLLYAPYYNRIFNTQRLMKYIYVCNQMTFAISELTLQYDDNAQDNLIGPREVIDPDNTRDTHLTKWIS